MVDGQLDQVTVEDLSNLNDCGSMRTEHVVSAPASFMPLDDCWSCFHTEGPNPAPADEAVHAISTERLTSWECCLLSSPFSGRTGLGCALIQGPLCHDRIPESPSLRTTMWNSPIYLLLWSPGNLLSLIGVLTNDCSIANSFTSHCHAKTNASLKAGNKTCCLIHSHCEPHWFCMLYHIMHAILLIRFSISKKSCIEQKLNPNPSIQIFPSSCRICFPFSHSSLCRDLC